MPLQKLIKKKQKTLQQLVKILDTAFSKMIRARDEGKPCIDLCGKPDGPMQCGHFRRRGFMSTRFHPKNCNSQRMGCNFYLSKASDEYRHSLGIDKRWGEGTARELYLLSRQEKRWKRKELEALIEACGKGIKAYEKVYYGA